MARCKNECGGKCPKRRPQIIRKIMSRLRTKDTPPQLDPDILEAIATRGIRPCRRCIQEVLEQTNDRPSTQPITTPENEDQK